MQNISVNILLNYGFNFLLIFVICLFGSFTRDAYNTVSKKTKISVIRIIISSLFSSIILSALNEYAKLSFGIFVFVCFCVGMWSFEILKVFFNFKAIFIVIKNIFKQFKDPVFKGISDAMEEVEKQEKENKKNEEQLEEEKKDDKSP